MEYYEIIHKDTVVGVCCIAPEGHVNRTSDLLYIQKNHFDSKLGAISKEYFDTYGDCSWVTPLSVVQYKIALKFILTPVSESVTSDS